MNRTADLVLAGSYLALGVSGIILIKLGLRSSEFRLNSSIMLLIDPLLALGLLAYLASFALWIPVLDRFDVSFIYPTLAGLAQILILAASIWVLGESPGRVQIAGALLVAVGVAMIGIGLRD